MERCRWARVEHWTRTTRSWRGCFRDERHEAGRVVLNLETNGGAKVVVVHVDVLEV